MKKLRAREIAKNYGVKLKRFEDNYEVVYPVEKHLTSRVIIPAGKQDLLDFFKHEEKRTELLENYYGHHIDGSPEQEQARADYESFQNPTILDQVYDFTRVKPHIRRFINQLSAEHDHE